MYPFWLLYFGLTKLCFLFHSSLWTNIKIVILSRAPPRICHGPVSLNFHLPFENLLKSPYTPACVVFSTVHTNPSQKRSFSKTLFKPEEIRVVGKHFENGAFPKQWHHNNHVISLIEFSSNTNPKWSVIVAFSNFSGVVWKENIWCVFRVKPPFSNFSGVVWTQNIWCIFGVKPPFWNSSGLASVNGTSGFSMCSLSTLRFKTSSNTKEWISCFLSKTLWPLKTAYRRVLVRII